MAPILTNDSFIDIFSTDFIIFRRYDKEENLLKHEVEKENLCDEIQQSCYYLDSYNFSSVGSGSMHYFWGAVSNPKQEQKKWRRKGIQNVERGALEPKNINRDLKHVLRTLIHWKRIRIELKFF